ncbi:hypothetical protein MCOR14_009645 [Pyricularia oryzae]|nr:hypothetical protein MCOR32_008202 [Pyricularia oryzae]KAI6622926.1 hypothetical protein MCOR14_009645 [Pyricularia oryzae]
MEGQTIIGNPSSAFWLFDGTTYDLTHPDSPTTPSPSPSIRLPTSTAPILISPSKTALVIVDMQNFFLSPALGRPAAPDSPGNLAARSLLDHAIPAARRAGIQILYLNWGLTDDDLAALPPVLFRAFGTRRVERPQGGGEGEVVSPPGLGDDLGSVTLADGSTVPAGRKLVRGQWNAALHPPLQASCDESQRGPLPDRVFHKNRISGFQCGPYGAAAPPIYDFLRRRGIATLLFAGVNTDQCVLGSLQDACNAGFDAVLLRDCVGTSSPDFARLMVEFNCRRTWGFVAEGKALTGAVEEMLAGGMK